MPPQFQSLLLLRASKLGEGDGPKVKRRLVTRLQVDRGFSAAAGGSGVLRVADLVPGIPVHLKLAVMLHDDGQVAIKVLMQCGTPPWRS